MDCILYPQVFMSPRITLAKHSQSTYHSWIKKLDLTAYETLRLTGSQCLLSNMYQIVQIRWHRPLAHNANFLHGWLPSSTPETHNKKVTHKPNHLHDSCVIDLINFLWSIAFNNIFQVISYCFREGSLIALKHIETT